MADHEPLVLADLDFLDPPVVCDLLAAARPAAADEISTQLGYFGSTGR